MPSIARLIRRPNPIPLYLLLGGIVLLCGCRRVEKTPTSAPSPDERSEVPRELTSPTGIEMVLVPGGTFRMGCADEIDAKPEHEVSIGPFYMSRFEVTQDVYEQMIGKNPSKAKGTRRPVERVTWLDAVKFCNALSRKEGLTPCYDLETRRCDFDADGYRLPTEAEWEYAYRAGTTGDYYFGAASGLEDHAWAKTNTLGRTQPVGKKKPNPFGLYDMAGNVREWCNDWYHVSAYKARAGKTVADPVGPGSGEKKVLRGGAWSVGPESCTAWARYCEDPGFTDACLVNDDCGFRVVRRPPELRKRQPSE